MLNKHREVYLLNIKDDQITIIREKKKIQIPPSLADPHKCKTGRRFLCWPVFVLGLAIALDVYQIFSAAATQNHGKSQPFLVN